MVDRDWCVGVVQFGVRLQHLGCGQERPLLRLFPQVRMATVLLAQWSVPAMAMSPTCVLPALTQQCEPEHQTYIL